METKKVKTPFQKTLSEIIKKKKNGTLRSNDRSWQISFLFGEPFDATYKDLTGLEILRAIQQDATNAELEFDEMEVSENSSLVEFSFFEIMQILFPGEEDKTSIVSIEEVDDFLPKPSLHITQIPMLPPLKNIWKEQLASLVYLDIVLSSVPSGNFLLSSKSNDHDGIAIIQDGSIYHALWLSKSETLLDSAARDAFNFNKDGTLSLYEIDADLAEYLEFCWKMPLLIEENLQPSQDQNVLTELEKYLTNAYVKINQKNYVLHIIYAYGKNIATYDYERSFNQEKLISYFSEQTIPAYLNSEDVCLVQIYTEDNVEKIKEIINNAPSKTFVLKEKIKDTKELQEEKDSEPTTETEAEKIEDAKELTEEDEEKSVSTKDVGTDTIVNTSASQDYSGSGFVNIFDFNFDSEEYDTEHISKESSPEEQNIPEEQENINRKENITSEEPNKVIIETTDSPVQKNTLLTSVFAIEEEEEEKQTANQVKSDWNRIILDMEHIAISLLDDYSDEVIKMLEDAPRNFNGIVQTLSNIENLNIENVSVREIRAVVLRMKRELMSKLQVDE